MSVHDFHARSIELDTKDQAVFAALTPMLSTSAASCMEQKQRQDLVLRGDSRDEATEIEMDSADATSSAAAAASAHFALLSERAETMCVVLRNGAVLYLGFPAGSNSSSVSVPSVVLRRLEPTKFTAAVQDSHDSDDVLEVTAVSLFPLDIAFACRVDLRGERRGDSGTALHAAEEPNFTHLRGIVGCSNGRVSVFSERGYTFSFSAHHSAVTNVAAIYCHNDEPASDDCYAKNGTCNTRSTRPKNSNAGAGDTQTSPHVWRQSLMRALRHVGIVTEGLDGQIVIWRRGGRVFEPRAVIEPGVLTRHIAFSAYTPSARNWMLHPYLTLEAGELIQPPQLRASILVRSTSTMQHGIHVGSIMDYEAVASSESGSHDGANDAPASDTHADDCDEDVPKSVNILYNKRDLACWGREADFGTYVNFSGGKMVYTTAIASNEDYGLVARERQLYAVDYATQEVTLVMTASRKITNIDLHCSFATVWGCDSGVVYILQVRPFAVLGRYRSARHRRLISCSVDSRTLFMTLVGVDNTVELVRLPESYLTEINQPTPVTVEKSSKAEGESRSSTTAAVEMSGMGPDYSGLSERLIKHVPTIPSEPVMYAYNGAIGVR